MSTAITAEIQPATLADPYAERIRVANARFASEFRLWIEEVGTALKDKRTELAKNGSHNSKFDQWVDANTPFSHRHANRLIDAHQTMALLGPIGPGTLPANEAQCRELACVPEDKRAELWQNIVETAERDGEPITGAWIRDAADLLAEPKKVTRENILTGNVEWYTPAEHIERCRNVMGGIDLDPASNEFAQATVQAERFYTEQDDGLDQDWAGRVFLNPPFKASIISQFTAKLCAEHKAGNVVQAVFLSDNATDCAWWQETVRTAAAVCFTSGRTKFYGPGGEGGSPTRGQTFMYFGDRVDRFLAEFAEVGWTVRTH